MSCRLTPPLNLVSLLRMLALPLHSVESLSFAAPAAFRRMSNTGPTVSSFCFQNSSFDRVVRNS